MKKTLSCSLISIAHFQRISSCSQAEKPIHCLFILHLQFFIPLHFNKVRRDHHSVTYEVTELLHVKQTYMSLIINDSKSNMLAIGTGGHVVRPESPKTWLVAHVHICHEKKTSERLTKMKIENFLPIQKEVHQWSDRRKTIDHVLLPMMLFVHVDPLERKEVLMLSSISKYLVMRGESIPAVIPDEQMERFRFMLDYSSDTVCMNTVPLAPGEKVRVIKGPLIGLEGELVTLNGKSKIAVRLNMLGCACVDMTAGFVERING